MFIQTTSQLPSVQNDVLTGQYAGLRLYSCNCNTVHFRYVRYFFRTMFFLFSYSLFLIHSTIQYYHLLLLLWFFLRFFLFIPISLLFCALPCTVYLPVTRILSLSLTHIHSHTYTHTHTHAHQVSTKKQQLLASSAFLMDREIYHTLCIVYYNNHYV